MSDFKPRDPHEFGFKDIIYEKKDWIATVTINRPQVFNSYSILALREMCEAFKDASWDDSIAVVVLTGAGDRAFCTGGDVKEYSENYTVKPRDFWKWMGDYNMAHDLLRNCGNEFHMSCDLSIAAEHARIMQVGVRVGSVAAGGATQYLPIIVGDRRAREILYLCEPLSAQKAMDWGLVNQVVPSLVDEKGEYIQDPKKKAEAMKDHKKASIKLDALDEAVKVTAGKLVEKFPECMRYTKQQLNFWKDLSWHSTIGHARDWLSVHFASWEPYEGMKSFVEKRPADYMKIRERAAAGGSSEFMWGPATKDCPACNAKGIPEMFKYCGACGAKL
jgi:1,4-dihydroxy-2-naphthoyl-CoA synthase